MNIKFYLFSLTLTILVFGGQQAIWQGNTIANAQTYTSSNRIPIADRTIGTKVSGGNNQFKIDGGLTKGHTLFHSFTDFSVPKGGAANFINPVGNRDIITRVTGNKFSDINGLINSNGANFFLINPNGITFGTNARLNVGKAFMVSTANGINLVDSRGQGITFGTNTSGDALLKVAPNILFNVSSLTMGEGNGQINNFGTLQTTTPNQYIGLIGGKIAIDGGKIIAPGGRVEIGGTLGSETVTFTDPNHLHAQFSTNATLADVSIANQAVIDVAGANGGDIYISVRNLKIFGDSLLNGGIGLNLGTSDPLLGDSGKAGHIQVKSSGAVDINESTISVGNGSSINLDTESLSLNNSVISASQSDKKVGDIQIKAIGAINIVDSQILNRYSENNYTGLIGKGGNINIEAGSLTLQNNARVSTASSLFQQGSAGDIRIKVDGTLQMNGGINSFNANGIFTSVGIASIGNSGNITIDADAVSLKSGAKISASIFGKGDAGDVKIAAKNDVSLVGAGSNITTDVKSTAGGQGGDIQIIAGSLSLKNGARVTSGNFTGPTKYVYSPELGKQRDAGNVTIAVTGNVDISGAEKDFGSGIFTSVETSNSYSVFIPSNPNQNIVGNGGNITIDAGTFDLSDGGILFAATSGFGDAGNITVNAKDRVNISSNNSNLRSGLFVDSNSPNGIAGDINVKAPQITLTGGTIASKSLSGNGGNINIKQADLLLLLQGSSITTDARGNALVGGNGGNINIDSELIVAIPTENSDITANAIKGRGGNVKIDASGLFGIAFQPTGSILTNDITASSDFGQSGNVNITTPGTDPGKDSTQLPNVPTDASNQISQACSASTRDSKLAVTGRGGLPPNAFEPLTGDVVWQDARATSSQPAPTSATNTPTKLAPPAVGWVFDGKGKVILIAAGTQEQTAGTNVSCPQGKK
jgi:filamentous hemagglutinin family protein